MATVMIKTTFDSLVEPTIRKRLGFKVMPLERIRWDMTWAELDAVAHELAQVELMTQQAAEQLGITVSG